MLLLSVDSYLSIRWPMKYRIGEVMTVKRTVIALACVWILAAALAALPVIARDYIEFSKNLVTMFYLPFIKPLQVRVERDHISVSVFFYKLIESV